MSVPKAKHVEQISLDSATRHILEECRMVLPGIQAIFGFQLIAVFNNGFSEKLAGFDQKLHFVSLLLVALAAAFAMAPAALHRQTQPCSVSDRFLMIASKLLLASMLSLAIGLCLEVYLIGLIIFKNVFFSVGVALVLFLVFLALWLWLPCHEKESISKVG